MNNNRANRDSFRGQIVSYCALCSREALKEGKNGFILCPVHNWIKGVKQIAINERRV